MERFRIVMIASLVLALGACATTKQARKVETSGFLADYSMLKKGRKGEALLIYKSPDADLSSYRKIMLDPVTIWKAEDSELNNIPEEDLQRLADYLHAKVLAELGKDWEMVDQLGPGVLRIRSALTEAGKSFAPLNTVSTIVPFTRAFSELKNLATGSHTFVGAASVEAEITDGDTGSLLFAAVDRRVGGKTVSGSTKSWSDVEEAFDYWAQRLAQRLREERGY